MELSAKIFNGWKPLTIYAKASVLDTWLGSKCASAMSEMIVGLYARNHSFSVYAKFSVKLTLFAT